MKQVLIVAMICMIFAAMSGCVDSDAEPASITNILDNTASIDNQKDVVYIVDIILSHSGEPSTMEVEMYVDNTATIITTTVSDEVVETGAWQLYRESPDHTLYDITTTDGTELRLAFRNDAQAIAYIYYDGFTRWDNSFYGTWEQINEEPTDDEPDEPTPTPRSTPTISDMSSSITSDRSDEMPLTVYLDCFQIHKDLNNRPDMVEIILGQGGIATICGDSMQGDDCVPSEWTQVGKVYKVETEHLCTMRISLNDDGTSEIRMEGIPWALEAEWSEGVS